MNILYVEDDPLDADLTRRALLKTAPHFKLDIARTQREAFEYLEGEPDYDLMFTDLRLPDGDGFTLLSHVRERGLPMAIVVITGQGDEEIAVAVLKAGADDYLVKRQDYLDRLSITLESALHRYRAEIARRSRPLRVLYLDQNPTDIDLTRRHFATHAPHIHLELVQTEVDVFERLPGRPAPIEYDALMFDYRLHGLNALELLKELRQVRGLRLPILLVTGHGDEEVAAQALRLGASDYVVKSPGYLYQLPGLLENAYHHAQLLHQQDALQASEERYRRLAENAPDVIYRYRLNPTRCMEYISPAVTSITGFTPQEFYADPDLVIKIVHPDDQAIMENFIQGKYPQGAPVMMRFIRKDNTNLWIEGRSAIVYDDDGNLVALEGINRDITERKQAEENIQRQLQRLNALRMVDMAIASSHDLRLTLAILLENVTLQLGVHAADILLFNSYTQMLEHSLGRGFNSRAVENTRLQLGQGNAGLAAMERRTIFIPNSAVFGWSKEPAEFLPEEGFAAYYCTPLVAKSQIKGVLRIFHRTQLNPDPEWLNFLETLAGQAAIAIDDAELFERLQRANLELIMAYDTTLEGWVHALDLRDKETQGHTQRVTNLTIRLARELGINEDSLIHVRRGALLHDIGKIGIPDNILHKPGPLTDEEWKIMRRHPIYAYELLSPITYLRQALAIPYCHHERWDGTGYPRQLNAEQIPLEARIFTVVDVWDALSSDRPYRKAWEEERVFEYICAHSGSHFDPIVVEKFLEFVNDGSL